MHFAFTWMAGHRFTENSEVLEYRMYHLSPLRPWTTFTNTDWWNYDRMVPRPSDCEPGPHIITAIWRCRKPFSQWQCSFQLKAAQPFANRLATAPYCYNVVIMSAMVSQITNLTIVYLTVFLCADQRKHQSSASLAFMRGIHWQPVNSPHKGPVLQKMFSFDDVIMASTCLTLQFLFKAYLVAVNDA